MRKGNTGLLKVHKGEKRRNEAEAIFEKNDLVLITD